ncbi:hypothetical protein HMPREF2531_03379 [Bacteroides intestinalis]|uniref:Uncharacterized protein n=1 Tax=Bacteroides intestinalis TaxID=329854 RepID=A0A139L2Q4_9BACE|nr:hypothetical protein HMPREF2531_03379 [Bacteroides intestinalis]
MFILLFLCRKGKISLLYNQMLHLLSLALMKNLASIFMFPLREAFVSQCETVCFSV